ncbi:MAG: YggS family pyridoxal phosphate enzyme [Alphaproteobacteria bacterium 33-17]|nr:MAG: YggS family pyridoxal phosphate enzyme [Alphaproteobacteria bacterium 33-17]
MIKPMNQKILAHLPSNIKLIAVTKGRPAIDIINLDTQDFGENRIEEIESKWEAEPLLRNLLNNKNVNIHFIGKLSGKKIKRIVKFCSYIHSLDSIKHAALIDKAASDSNKIINCFIQVNLAKEPQKSGIDAGDLNKFIEECNKFHNLKVIGLMTMPPVDVDPSPYFQELQNLAKQNNLSGLSMGMSDDYEIAIKYGANYIRIGRKLFE